MYIRQGDVVLVRIGDGDTAGTPREVTLAVGEESGHRHAIAVLSDVTTDGERVVTVGQGAQVVVQPETMVWRHDPIAVPPGAYRVVIEREYTPTAIRRVED